MITFVTYYAEFTPRMVDGINKVYEKIADGPYENNCDQLQLALAMFRSAKRSHPGAKMVLLADRPVEMPPFVEVVALPRESDFFEVESIRAKVAFMENFVGEESHLLFLDSDIVVCGNVEEIFRREGDIFFTYRILSDFSTPLEEGSAGPEEKVYMQFPINIGVIAVKGGAYRRAIIFFEEMISLLDRCEREEVKYWCGLQYLLKKLFQRILMQVGYEAPLTKVAVSYKGVDIRLLDGGIYNYTPLAYDHIPIDVKIAHFKGMKRKKEMMLFSQRVSKRRG